MVGEAGRCEKKGLGRRWSAELSAFQPSLASSLHRKPCDGKRGK